MLIMDFTSEPYSFLFWRKNMQALKAALVPALIAAVVVVVFNKFIAPRIGM
jgi:hypothetical protein